jgi:NAD(P)-dependent dehydrogenase (short-subunit alcohol dehydrogenase family)
MQKQSKKKPIIPPQHQRRPGLEHQMRPAPVYETPLPGSNKLGGKTCVVTGGDSGIGKAAAIAFAKEGANVAIIYLSETSDAKETSDIITSQYSRECLLIRSDISKERNCIAAIEKVAGRFDKIDVLVNNAAVQFNAEGLEDLKTENLEKTFAVNILAMFWLTKAALDYMSEGSSIINTTSVTAYRGSAHLLDYSATKGAIVTFTRSLSSNLAERGIRVNGVAPGPVWTPLTVSSYDAEEVKTFGTDVPMKRPGQPGEIAPAYVYLASADSSYVTGQIIHVNGGEIVNG